MKNDLMFTYKTSNNNSNEEFRCYCSNCNKQISILSTKPNHTALGSDFILEHHICNPLPIKKLSFIEKLINIFKS